MYNNVYGSDVISIYKIHHLYIDNKETYLKIKM